MNFIMNFIMRLYSVNDSVRSLIRTDYQVEATDFSA